MKKIIERFRAETPAFFKKVQLVAAGVSTMSVTAQTTLSQYLPEYANTFLQHAAVCGIVSIVLAQFTKADPKP